MSKVLHQLGFKITDEFLNNSNYNVYKTGDTLVDVVHLIRSYAKEKLRGEWEANNVLRSPYTINNINPTGLIMRTTGKDEDFLEFYCHSTLSQNEIQRAMYLISNSINEFIARHREGLEEFTNGNVDLTHTEFNCSLSGTIHPKFLLENVSLIKALFIKELAFKTIKVGVEENDRYITEGMDLQFYPSYTKSGHELISEIVEVEIQNKIQKLAIYIHPNIEAVDGELYIFPIFGVRRFVPPADVKKALQWSSAKTNSLLIFDGKDYHSPRVKWCRSDSQIKLVSEDWKLYQYLNEYKGISFEDDIKPLLEEGLESSTILLPYNNKLGVNSKLGAGIPSSDKFDIFNYIVANIPGLEPVGPNADCLWKHRVDYACINQGNSKLMLDKCIYRNSKTDITLHLVSATPGLYEEVTNVIETMLIDGNKGLTIKEKGSYTIAVPAATSLTLNVVDSLASHGLGPTYKDETIATRVSKLKHDMKLGTGFNIALVELPKRDSDTDAKSIVRTALNKLSVVNQFILPKEKARNNEVRSAILDLLNDIGLGSRVQLLEDNEVIYTMHKVCGIEVVARMDNTTIEVAAGTEFVHITEALRFIGGIPHRDFVEILEADNRRKIVILEGGEEQKNSMLYSMDHNYFINIKAACDVFVTTDLLNREIVQTQNGSVSKGVAYYKIKDGVYISIGHKVKGETASVNVSSKLRRWINTRNTVTTGADVSYMDRVGYEIRAFGDYDDSICRLVHNLRLGCNTHIHLNRTILVDYVNKLSKHILAKGKLL